MSDSTDYVPPKVWVWNQTNGGRFATINRPVAGATHEKELPVGKHPLQLYSQGTPNGVKVTILLEELLAAGYSGAEYDAWLIRIGEGQQFSTGFVAVNPNSKIPALVDRSGPTPVRVFESGAILLYLAEKFGAFLPASGAARAECLSWLFWQMGSAPYIGGGFGHFYAYAPTKMQYPIRRARPAPGGKRVHRRAGLHHRRHGGLALVRRPREQLVVQCRRVPAGRHLPQRPPLDRPDPRAPRRAARPDGQPHHGRPLEPAARAA
jgi:glutathione S-transferase